MTMSSSPTATSAIEVVSPKPISAPAITSATAIVRSATSALGESRGRPPVRPSCLLAAALMSSVPLVVARTSCGCDSRSRGESRSRAVRPL